MGEALEKLIEAAEQAAGILVELLDSPDDAVRLEAATAILDLVYQDYQT